MMSLTLQSYRKIREALLDDDALLDERLSINKLSERLGIGRSPVRDAVNRLAAEGLLQPVAKSGIVVRRVSFEQLQDIVGLREALEPYAAAQACARMDYRQHRRLRSLCLELRRLARQVFDADFRDRRLNRAMQGADRRFHGLIVKASGNRMLQKIVEDHQLLLRKVRYPSMPTAGHLAGTLLEHWRICRALAGGDAQAARLWMQRHARRGGNAMLASWHELYAGEGR